jgi:CxC2 like cysteine cluster associated with KDZ transposases
LFFEPITLKALGARIQLGHIVGDPCPNPRQAKGDAFVIIDTHGIHDVGLDFCGCESSKGVVRQLLRSRLYPATVQNPATAATFRVLERFHLLSFESKCSAYEFYHSLVHESDNIGIQPPKVCISPRFHSFHQSDDLQDRYDELLRMVREWRHLKVLNIRKNHFAI